MRAGTGTRITIVGVPANANDSLRGAMRVGDKLCQRTHDAIVKGYSRCALSADNIDDLESRVERAIVALCLLDDVPVSKARAGARQALLNVSWAADDDANDWLTNIRRVLRTGPGLWRRPIRLVSSTNEGKAL